MPSYILQPTAGEEFFVYWSTVVDDALGWGNEAELVREFPMEVMSADRFARARETGSSSLVGWSKRGEPLMVGQQGMLPWDALPDYIARIVAGQPTDDLIQPFNEDREDPT